MIQGFSIIFLVCMSGFSESGGGKEIVCMSIDELYQYCNLPASCGEALECEGKKIRVMGYIDWENIFFKEEYQQLPYDKFIITDRESEKKVEVWVNPETARAVYQRMQQQRKKTGKEVFVSGTISGFDMPVMGSCCRGIKIELQKPEDLEFR